MAVAYNLKRLFKKSSPEIPSFKQFNYLNLLPENHLMELLQFVEHQNLPQVIPLMENKKILFLVNISSNYYLHQLQSQHPNLITEYHLEYPLQAAKENESLPITSLKVRGHLMPLPFKKDFFDIIIFPLVNFNDLDVIGLFGEMGRILAHTGRLVISVRHPMLDFLLHNQNPNSAQASKKTFEHYCQGLKQCHFFLEHVQEGLIDKVAKSFFKEVDFFQEFKGLPVVLLLKAVKFNQKSGD